MLLQTRRIALATALLATAAGAPAEAAEVIVVDGDRAVRRDDPLVPSRAEAALGRPPGGRAIARASHLSARGTTVRGQRAVGSALRRALRGGGISRGRFHRYRRA
jgi:hypothetical protein